VQVTLWAPAAAGTGVTLVMAYLNGNNIPHILSFKTLVTKIIGCALSVASGLAIGPEGPMVHIGACIASNITYAHANLLGSDWSSCWFWPWRRCLRNVADGESASPGSHAGEQQRMPTFCATCEELHEDSEHREFISAGASAGLSVRFCCM
jgi:chloride channel 7